MPSPALGTWVAELRYHLYLTYCVLPDMPWTLLLHSGIKW
jgi:hypothetical protein